MSKKKDKSTEIAVDQVSDDLDETTAPEESPIDKRQMRIRVNVNVNGHRAGDTLVVDRDHPFYSAILKQKLAEEIN